MPDVDSRSSRNRSAAAPQISRKGTLALRSASAGTPRNAGARPVRKRSPSTVASGGKSAWIGSVAGPAMIGACPRIQTMSMQPSGITSWARCSAGDRTRLSYQTQATSSASARSAGSSRYSMRASIAASAAGYGRCMLADDVPNSSSLVCSWPGHRGSGVGVPDRAGGGADSGVPNRRRQHCVTGGGRACSWIS